MSWKCDCGIEHGDKDVCSECGMALEDDEGISISTKIEQILDEINSLLEKAYKILQRGGDNGCKK